MIAVKQCTCGVVLGFALWPGWKRLWCVTHGLCLKCQVEEWKKIVKNQNLTIAGLRSYVAQIFDLSQRKN